MYSTAKAKFSVDYNKLFHEVLNKKGTISECFSMFHNYSINNQFLAYYQMKSKGMSLQPINSFTGWNKLNRKINKGEKAMYLWQPIQITDKVKDENGEVKAITKTIFTFKPKWFALEQTSGEELQPDKIEIKGFDFNAVYKAFGIKLVKFEKINGNIQGYANPKAKTLALNPLAKDAEMTIFHEVAHIVLKHAEVNYDSELKELEAETVAYIIGSVLNLPEQQLSDSRGYIQGWFKENEIPEKQAKNIMSAAQKILKVGLIK